METYWSDRKMVISGSIVEVYKYNSKYIQHGYKNNEKKVKKADSSPHNDDSERISQSRARKGLRRLINSNATDLTKFITLTFADNITDVEYANNEFMKFIKRLKRWILKNYPDHELKYVTVIEFQKRGAVHYHMLANVQYIANEVLAKLWTHGFVGINQIDHITNVGAYVAKYMSKDERDERLWNKKLYFTSRNLEKPVEVNKKEEVQVLESVLLAGSTPVYSNSFENDFVGSVTYEQYNLMNEK